MITRALQLRRKGVIGINARNVSLINPLNHRRDMQLVNDKTLTKQLAEKAGIPTPKFYGALTTSRECKKLPYVLNPETGGAIKPARGTQGKGIMIVQGKVENGWQLANGRIVDEDELIFHAINLTSGMFSLAGQPDTVLVEERVVYDDVFRHVTYEGVPDIRVIVLKGIPIAAMLRLPTSKSDGKANLHRGGVGAGLDIATGQTMSAMIGEHPISHHPDTNAPLIGLQVPHWKTILEMATRAYDVTGLGYLGADIVLDRHNGPLLLELNARPGLSIQIAMGTGLKPFVDQVIDLDTAAMSLDDRLAFSEQLIASVRKSVSVQPRKNETPHHDPVGRYKSDQLPQISALTRRAG